MGTTLEAGVLELDPVDATERIVFELRRSVGGTLRRRGTVVGVSGGVDSAVTCALCARAFGPEHVLGVLAAETDSEPETLELSQAVGKAFDVPYVVEDITPILAAARCYERRDEMVQTLVPEFGAGWKLKIVLPNVIGNDMFRVLFLVTESPNDRQESTGSQPSRASQSWPRRTQAAHAEDARVLPRRPLDFAVAGTPNPLEYDRASSSRTGRRRGHQADRPPLRVAGVPPAEYLEIPEADRRRLPPRSFAPRARRSSPSRSPHETMDLCLYAQNAGLPEEADPEVVGLSAGSQARLPRHRAEATDDAHLHFSALLVEPVAEISVS